MSRYQRVIGSDGRIAGKWVVLAGRERGESQELIIKPIDVTIYDESRRFGRILYPSDLTAWVVDGEVDLKDHMIADHIRPEVDEVRDELIELLRMVAQAFIDGPRDPVPASPVSGASNE